MTRKIGVITNNRHQVFQRTIIAGVQEIADSRGYEVVIDSIAEDPSQPAPVSLNMAEMAGILVIADILTDDHLRQLYHSGVPVSLVSYEVSDTPIPAVMTNNTQGMVLLMRHLVVECGCQQLVFIRGNMNQTDGVDRDYAFWREVMRYNLSIPSEFVLNGDFDASLAEQLMKNLLQEHREFDGVIAADYLMALAAVKALRATGIRVPEDVQVAGFGDGADAEIAGLTTVAADVIEQGRRSARQLIGQIEGLRIRGVTVLNTNLIPRSTTRIHSS